MRAWLAIIFSLITTLAVAGFNDFGLSGFSLTGGGAPAQYVDLVQNLTGWTPSSTAFGDVSTNTVKRQTFTFSNTGNDYAEDVTVSVTGAGFALYSTTTFGNLSASRTRTAKVRFSPTAAQAYSGYLNYSAPNIARVQAALSGTGTESAPTYIVNQNFEGTGYDNSESWTASSAGVNPDYTTTLLSGSQSLSILGNGSSYDRAYFNTANNDTVYIHLMVRITSDNTSQFFKFGNDVQAGGGTIAGYLQYSAGGFLTYSHGSTAINLSGIALNTNYHVWLTYSKGTGSNGIGRVDVGTSNLYANATKTGSTTTGNGTSTSNQYVLINNPAYRIIYDQLIVSNSAAIGDVP